MLLKKLSKCFLVNLIIMYLHPTLFLLNRMCIPNRKDPILGILYFGLNMGILRNFARGGGGVNFTGVAQRGKKIKKGPKA